VGNKWDKFGDARDLEIPPGGNPFWCMVIYYIVKPIKKIIKFIRKKKKKKGITPYREGKMWALQRYRLPSKIINARKCSRAYHLGKDQGFQGVILVLTYRATYCIRRLRRCDT
jgi:hypothetical protein